MRLAGQLAFIYTPGKRKARSKAILISQCLVSLADFAQDWYGRMPLGIGATYA